MAVSNSPSQPSRQPHASRATAATARSRPRGCILPGRRSVSAAKAPDDLDSRRNGRAGTVTVSDDFTGRRCVIAENGDLEAVPGSVRTGPCSPPDIGTLRARTASGRRAGRRGASGNPLGARPRQAGKRLGRPRPIFRVRACSSRQRLRRAQHAGGQAHGTAMAASIASPARTAKRRSPSGTWGSGRHAAPWRCRCWPGRRDCAARQPGSGPCRSRSRVRSAACSRCATGYAPEQAVHPARRLRKV